MAYCFCGLPSFAESEGYDRKNLSLPENQLELLKQLAGAGKKIIVVLTNGSAVELGEVRSFASAILECWYAGDVYAQACCDVLFGNVNPSGRLAETLPLHLSDYFPEENYVDAKDCVRYREGENVGYKYYAAAGRRVCYPFGYGLSYTKFEYESCRLAPATQKGAELSAEVTLRNAGGRAGKEVVQVYLRHESEKVYSLAGFSKVELQAGKAKSNYRIGFGMFYKIQFHAENIRDTPGKIFYFRAQGRRNARLGGQRGYRKKIQMHPLYENRGIDQSRQRPGFDCEIPRQIHL
ncbi:MAG: glycoside hydrolase family 3 C-terminal domain-containing protein [Christensenellaceae bacterium]